MCELIEIPAEEDKMHFNSCTTCTYYRLDLYTSVHMHAWPNKCHAYIASYVIPSYVS